MTFAIHMRILRHTADFSEISDFGEATVIFNICRIPQLDVLLFETVSATQTSADTCYKSPLHVWLYGAMLKLLLVSCKLSHS